MSVNIEIQLDTPDAKMPYQKYGTDAGWDLYCSRDQIIDPNKTVDIHTDIHIHIPEGYYGRITGRSSTLRNHNLLVNEGIIDSNYTGELFICVRNMGACHFSVKKGMRLAQIIFHKLPEIEFEHVLLLTAVPNARNSRGFGHSGL